MPRRAVAQGARSKAPVPAATLEARTQATAASATTSILRPGHNCWRIAQREQARVPRRRRGLFPGGARGDRARRSGRSSSSAGTSTAASACPGRRQRRLARTARRLPERAGQQATRIARLRAELGLRDALRARARVDADLQARLAHAPPTVVPARREASDRRLAPPEVVVVDDSVAFVSGFDLSRSRWDTSEHRCEEPRRRNPFGLTYGPFHDVGAVVEGECARAIGELARERWLRAQRARRARAPVDEPRRRTLAGVDRRRRCTMYRSRSRAPSPRSRTTPGVGEVRAAARRRDRRRAARHLRARTSTSRRRPSPTAMRARLDEPDGPEIALVVAAARRAAGSR